MVEIHGKSQINTQVKPGREKPKIKVQGQENSGGGGRRGREECSSSEFCRSERRGSSERSWWLEGTTRSDFLMHLNIIK